MLARTMSNAMFITPRQSSPDCLDSTGDEYLGNADDARAYNAQIQALGSPACNAETTLTTLCQQGNTIIGVLNDSLNLKGIGNEGNTAESCEGVAEAAGRIFNSCFRSDNTIRGRVAAADNPSVLVDVRATIT
ncbi:unnamed protein product [Discula destructiva]